MLFFAVLLALGSLLLGSQSKIIYAGVNESGGEFASGTLPGEFGTDYQFSMYPDDSILGIQGVVLIQHLSRMQLDPTISYDMVDDHSNCPW